MRIYQVVCVYSDGNELDEGFVGFRSDSEAKNY